MPADCMLITVEIDGRFAGAARELLAADARITVISGDALREVPGHAPFDLLFADSGVRDPDDFATLVGALRNEGQLTQRSWP